MNTSTKAKLHPDAAFIYASPALGELVDEEQAPLGLSKLLGGLRSGIEDTVIYYLNPESVRREIQNKVDWGAHPQAGELVAVGDQLGNHEGSVFYERSWNPVA